MKKYIKIIISILFFVIVLTLKVFSYSSSHVNIRDNGKSSSFISASSDIVLNQYMTLNNVNVVFSQDDYKYIFAISANSSVKIYGKIMSAPASSSTGALVPLLYKEENFGNGMKISESLVLPHADCYGLTCHTMGEVNIKNKTQSKYIDKYYLSRTEHTPIESVNTSNGERYYIPKSLRDGVSSNWGFKNTTSYPIYCNNNGEGVSLDRNSSYHYYTYIDENHSSYDTYYANMSVTISFNKKYIDDYRYLCFAQSLISEQMYDLGDYNFESYGVSVCSNTIDLKDYINCEHNWTYKTKDKKSHTMYCDKCKWDKEEAHSLLYEYDGIKYDVCTCSYIDKVKYRFHINDDLTGEVEEICDTDCSYSKHEFTHKKGYKFKWYEKYALKYKNPSNLSSVSNATYYDFVATTSIIDDIADYNSILYETKYSPIKYSFNYSNENNCDLKLDDKIEMQEIYYDEKAKLKKSIEVKGYEFKGWTLDKMGTKIYFIDLGDVTNYTTEDLKVYNIYPVYERMDFTVVYNAGNYIFADGKKEKVIKYNYFDNCELERPNINSSNYVFEGYVDSSGNKYKKLSDVRNIIDKMNKSNMILHLNLSVSSIGIGSAENTKKGGGVIEPTSESIYILNTEVSNITDIVETTGVSDNTLPYDYFYDARTNYNKINGMTNTDEEIVDEEIELDEDKPRVATISLINKFDNGKTKKSKLDLLKEFIEKNGILCAAIASVLFVLLILYEMFIIRHFSKKELGQMT